MQAAGKHEPRSGLQTLRRPARDPHQIPLPLQPEMDLRQIVRDASQALAFLDAVRLEELATSCRKLIYEPAAPGIVDQARQATAEMAVFARVLDATRANLEVMRRLRDLQEGRLGYVSPEKAHGND